MPVHLYETDELERLAPGRWRTPAATPTLPAQSVVPSWNLALPPGAALRARLELRRAGSWEPGVLVGVRGAALEPPPVLPPGLELAGDELRSPRVPIEAARLELEVDGAEAPRRAGLAFWPHFAALELPEDPVEPLLRQGRVRQHSLQSPESHRLCGPSSLTMALRHLVGPAEVLEVAAAVRCPWADIYGHWTYLAALAGERGLAAWVERGPGPARLARHLAQGRLVILSLQWREHELPGAPHASSDGHLVLAVGADHEGAWVMDPAFREAERQLARYDWQGLLRAWKSGAAVVLGPGP